MPRGQRAAALLPENEVARRVRRYERALLCIVRMRHEEERTAPITSAEGALAGQISEAVTAYERGLRLPPLPPPVVEQPAQKAAPTPAEDEPKRARRRRVVRRKPRAAAPIS